MGLIPHAQSHSSFIAGLGVILLVWAAWMTGSNESMAKQWHQGMAQPSGQVLVLGNDAVPKAASEGRMVLVTGTPTLVQAPRDNDFNVRADSPVLARKVEMFQWHEVRGTGPLSYQQNWIDHPVDSKRFTQPSGHANTQPFPFTGRVFTASEVRLGQFILAPAIVQALPGSAHPLPVNLSKLPANLQASLRGQGNYLTTVSRSGTPHLGDLRIQWLAKPFEEVTVVAQVHGKHLRPEAGAVRGPGFEVRVGEQSLTDVFAALPLRPKTVWTWRVLYLVLALVGAVMLLRAWERPSVRAPVALATAVVLLAVVTGVAWLV